jgi:hypothetical protein
VPGTAAGSLDALCRPRLGACPFACASAGADPGPACLNAGCCDSGLGASLTTRADALSPSGLVGSPEPSAAAAATPGDCPSDIVSAALPHCGTECTTSCIGRSLRCVVQLTMTQPAQHATRQIKSRRCTATAQSSLKSNLSA